MTHICVMSSHKNLYGGLIPGVNTLYRLFCFFKLFPMVGKGLKGQGHKVSTYLCESINSVGVIPTTCTRQDSSCNRPYSHKLLTINNYVNCPSNFAFARPYFTCQILRKSLCEYGLYHTVAINIEYTYMYIRSKYPDPTVVTVAL